MEIVKRLAQRPVTKIVAGVVAAVALYNILTSPAVVDPLGALFLAGAVPGTSIILAPDTILLILASLAGAVIITLVVMTLLRHLKLRRVGRVLLAGAEKHHRALPTETSEQLTLYERPEPVTTEPSAGRKLLSLNLMPVRRLAARVWNTLQTLYAKLGQRLAVTGRGARKVLIQAILAVTSGLTWLAAALLVAGELLGIAVKTYSLRLWRWSQPYLRRFDGWLEVRYHRLAADAKRRAGRSDRLQVLAMIYRQIRRGIRDYFR